MRQDEFEALVSRLERAARASPRAYRARVFLLAGLGNAYLAAVLLLILGLLLLAIASVYWLRALGVKLVLIVGAFLWLVVRALWVRIEPPAGEELTPASAPDLFARIEKLRRASRAPRFHHVLLTDDFNAAIVQVPRFAIFGGSRNYLLVGLPLLKGLTVEQFEAVLAHELGHLAGGHGRMGNWIYRLRLRWSRLAQVLDATESKGGFLFRPFLQRFAPYFNAYSFPLARANEYEADAASARLTSPCTAAEALTGVSVVAGYLEECFWPQVHGQADHAPQPHYAPFRQMGQRVTEDVRAETSASWLRSAMSRSTTVADTHPALKDRLAAIDEEPRLAVPGPGGAADRLLGRSRDELTGRLDRLWQEQIGPAWQERHRAVQEGRARLQELDARSASGEELPLADAHERARLTDTIGSDAEGALAQLRALHARAPDDAAVSFQLGALLLRRDDETGLELVERAMRLDPEAIQPGSELLRDFHWRHGRKAEAHAWHERLVERLKVLERVTKERNRITVSDTLEPHGLRPAELAAFVTGLKDVAGLYRAYLLRKRVEDDRERPLFVFGYRVTPPLRLHTKRRADQVLGRLQECVSFPGETLILCLDGKNSRFERRFRRVRGARVL